MLVGDGQRPPERRRGLLRRRRRLHSPDRDPLTLRGGTRVAGLEQEHAQQIVGRAQREPEPGVDRVAGERPQHLLGPSGERQAPGDVAGVEPQ